MFGSPPICGETTEAGAGCTREVERRGQKCWQHVRTRVNRNVRNRQSRSTAATVTSADPLVCADELAAFGDTLAATGVNKSALRSFDGHPSRTHSSLLAGTLNRHGPEAVAALLQSLSMPERAGMLERTFGLKSDPLCASYQEAAELRQRQAVSLVSEHGLLPRSALDHYNHRAADNPWEEVSRRELLLCLMQHTDGPVDSWSAWEVRIGTPTGGAAGEEPHHAADGDTQWRAPSSQAAAALVVGCLPEDIEAALSGPVVYNHETGWSVTADAADDGSVVCYDTYVSSDGRTMVDKYRVQEPALVSV